MSKRREKTLPGRVASDPTRSALVALVFPGRRGCHASLLREPRALTAAYVHSAAHISRLYHITTPSRIMRDGERAEVGVAILAVVVVSACAGSQPRQRRRRRGGLLDRRPRRFSTEAAFRVRRSPQAVDGFVDARAVAASVVRGSVLPAGSLEVSRRTKRRERLLVAEDPRLAPRGPFGGAVGSPSTRLSLGASYVGLALWTGTQSLFACLDRYQFCCRRAPPRTGPGR